jgi:hypothetical protein
LGFCGRRMRAVSSDSVVDDALQKLLSGGFDESPSAGTVEADGGTTAGGEPGDREGGDGGTDDGQDDQNGPDGAPKS